MTTKLDEIKARWAKATPGPWKAATNTLGGGVVDALVYQEGRLEAVVCETPASNVRYTKPEERAQNERNAEAIAAAPTDVACLVGEVERLRGHLDLVLRAWHDEAHQGDGFDERHVATYEAAKSAIACGARCDR